MKNKKSIIIIASLWILAILSVVLVLAVLRIQNPAKTILQPKADASQDQNCRAEKDCGDCVLVGNYYASRSGDMEISADARQRAATAACEMAQHGVSCINKGVTTGSINKADALKFLQDTAKKFCSGNTGGGGSGTGTGTGTGQGCNSSSPSDVWSCYQKSGNCAGSWACHNKTSGCPVICSGQGQGGSVTVNVRFSDGSNYSSSGTVRMLTTSACSSCNSSCSDTVCNPNREKAYSAGSGQVTWSSSTKGATYTFGFNGQSSASCTASSGDSCTITIQGSNPNPSPNPTTTGQEDECWGNNGANGRCFDVNNDGTVNMIDFSCISYLWLKGVSSSSSPRCGK